jgi:HEAT repeat protein
VRRELRSAQPEMRFEAARAAGELELADTAKDLARLTRDEDLQVQEAAIWSLGQIGGDYARQTLNRLLEGAKDEAEQDYIQEALDNLEFTDEVNAFSLFDMELDGEDVDLIDEDDNELDLGLDEDEAQDDEDDDSSDLDDEGGAENED